MKRLALNTMLVVACIGLAASAVAADPAELYKARCAMCHGADGQGTSMGNALKGNEFLLSSSADDVAALILNGRSGPEKKYKQFPMNMPAVKLEKADAAALASYVKSLASK